MQSGKHWIKRLIIFGLVLAVVGIGVHWAMGLDRFKYETAFNQAKQTAGQYMHMNGGKTMAGDRHDRGMMHGGLRGHHGADVGLAIGGGLLAAGAIVWFIKRRKKSGGTFAASTGSVVIPSTSDYLDQWEKEAASNTNHTNSNTKESI